MMPIQLKIDDLTIQYCYPACCTGCPYLKMPELMRTVSPFISVNVEGLVLVPRKIEIFPIAPLLCTGLDQVSSQKDDVQNR